MIQTIRRLIKDSHNMKRPASIPIQFSIVKQLSKYDLQIILF